MSMPNPGQQQAVSMEDVADRWGRRVASLTAELVQTELVNARLTAENQQLREQVVQLQGESTHADRQRPGAFAPTDAPV